MYIRHQESGSWDIGNLFHVKATEFHVPFWEKLWASWEKKQQEHSKTNTNFIGIQ